MLGPAGTGRALLPDSVFFPTISPDQWLRRIARRRCSPPASPVIRWRPSMACRDHELHGRRTGQPDPAVLCGRAAELGPPGNTSLAIRNINVFKTGKDLWRTNFRPPYSEHASIGIQRELRTDFVVIRRFRVPAISAPDHPRHGSQSFLQHGRSGDPGLHQRGAGGRPARRMLHRPDPGYHQRRALPLQRASAQSQ